jgi:hypothetical protein
MDYSQVELVQQRIELGILELNSSMWALDLHQEDFRLNEAYVRLLHQDKMTISLQETVNDCCMDSQRWGGSSSSDYSKASF